MASEAERIEADDSDTSKRSCKGKTYAGLVLSVVSGLHAGLGTYPSPPGVRVGEVLDVKFLENMLI